MLLSKNQIYEDIMAGKIRIINAWSIRHSFHPDKIIRPLTYRFTPLLMT